MTFTKVDLINQVHSTHPKLTKVQAREAVETILRIIKSSLGNGEDVLLSGFGKFSVNDKSFKLTLDAEDANSNDFASIEYKYHGVQLYGVLRF